MQPGIRFVCQVAIECLHFEFAKTLHCNYDQPSQLYSTMVYRIITPLPSMVVYVAVPSLDSHIAN